METVHKTHVSYGKGRKLALSKSQCFIMLSISCFAILLGSFCFLFSIFVIVNRVSQESPEASPGPGSVAMRYTEYVWTQSFDSSSFTSTQDFPNVSARQMGKAGQTMAAAVTLSLGAVADMASVQMSRPHEYGRIRSEALVLWLLILTSFFPPMGLADTLPKKIWKLRGHSEESYTHIHAHIPHTHTTMLFCGNPEMFQKLVFQQE